MKRRFVVLPLFGVIAVTLAGCGGGDITGSGSSGAAACMLTVEYEDRSYLPVRVEVAPLEGEPQGFAVRPGCNDTGMRNAPEDEMIPVSELPGVPPTVALVWSGRSDIVLFRGGIHALPQEIVALEEAPSCDPKDAPLRLVGPWLSIRGADGHIETDLAPPYDIDLRVEDASTERYMRARLTVRVPASLGRPLSRDDTRSSLRGGGTIEAVVRCEGSGFLAEQVRARPPR